MVQMYMFVTHYLGVMYKPWLGGVSFIPRPPRFLPSVCIHDNIRQPKTGEKQVFIKAGLWTLDWTCGLNYGPIFGPSSGRSTTTIPTPNQLSRARAEVLLLSMNTDMM